MSTHSSLLDKRPKKPGRLSEKKLGRPTHYRPEIGDEICEMIKEGHSLSTIALKLNINSRSVWFWLDAHPDFYRKYVRAREIQASTIVDEIMDVCRLPPVLDAYGRVDTGEIQHRRLLVDTLKWRAAKLLPRLYGDKVEHTGTGNQVTINIVTGVPTEPATKTVEAERVAEARLLSPEPAERPVSAENDSERATAHDLEAS